MASGFSQRYKHSTPSQQEDSDSHITAEAEAEEVRNSSSISSHPPGPSESITHPNASDPTKRWAPLDRRQSWDEQEMRHQMQSKLLGTEKGKETGFTEMEGHGAMGG